jgi:hypothetical protein
MRQRDFSAKSAVNLSYEEARLIRLRRRDAGGRQGRSMRRSILVAVFFSGCRICTQPSAVRTGDGKSEATWHSVRYERRRLSLAGCRLLRRRSGECSSRCAHRRVYWPPCRSDPPRHPADGYGSNPASEVIAEPRNCSSRRRSKSSLSAPLFASPTAKRQPVHPGCCALNLRSIAPRSPRRSSVCPKKKRAERFGCCSGFGYDALPIHFCNSASGTLRPCSGRI